MSDVKPIDPAAPGPELEASPNTDEKRVHGGEEDDSGDVGKEHTTKNDSEWLHEFRENEGYIIEVDSESGNAAATGVKLAKDGHTRLIPQPSDDPSDPLNWSWNKKHLTLFIVSLCGFLPDYGSAVGAVTLLPQAVEWNMTPDEVNHSQAGNVFMIGAGGVFAVAFSAWIGRLPVAFWWVLLSTATAAWCAGAVTFESFMAARILNGFFAAVMQAGGLITIQDIFFFHERARKINIWASFFIMSPYLGPLLAAFMIETQRWPVPFWVFFAINVLALALIVFFLSETYYNRGIPANEQEPHGNRISQLTGAAVIMGKRRPINSFGQAWWRTASVLLKPAVVLACFSYILFFAFAVGINTTLAIFVTPLYGFGPRQVGFFYFTPIVATALGEIMGHWLHDALARRYIRKHKGHFEPEVRLQATFLSTPFIIVGLVLIGQCLENGWHYMATAVSWGLYVFGLMITTVALSSYVLDSYPEASGEVSAWLNASRTIGGFIISYFQVTWAENQGTKVSFGIQGAICGVSFLFILVLLKWGKQMRVWAGPLNFATT
ncbi:major facilitator superfamily domain-containing protein [Bombardia bombarda]|uniref:Major facilitator superfamily domain-containing protein n=1 Tax=Bombardia bombarda TaxID=252184 RepID=A0AA40CEA2_9PEZI|nr:major facilitator superfamily domain-containing protein [Bombardia bombarda]